MSERKIHKTLSILIALILLLGVLAPIAEVNGEEESQSELSSDSDATLTTDSDNTWYIEEGSTEYLNDTVKALDEYIVINGTLQMNDAQLNLLIDGYNPYNITLNGGVLNLNNSVITTRLPDRDLLRPFLKTEIVANNGSEIHLRDGSSFSFPGWVRLNDSNLTLKNSSFEASEYEVPDYDYTWGYGSDWWGKEDQGFCPMLISKNSQIHMEDSEINDYYTHKKLQTELNNLGDSTNLMEWYSEESSYDLGNESDNANETIDEWSLFGGEKEQMPFPAADYPYLNPIEYISTLYLEVDYETSNEYQGTFYVNYSVSGTDNTTNIAKIDTSGQSGTITENLWNRGKLEDVFGVDQIDLDEFYRDEDRDEFLYDSINITLENHAQQGNVTTINPIKLHSGYENDIRLENSDMTVINSEIDIDFNPSDPNPMEDEMTSKDTYKQDSNAEHRVIRLYNNSKMRTYNMTITSGFGADSDPPIVESASSETEIYRWGHVNVTDKYGVPVPGANVSAIDYDNFDPGNHTQVIEYANKNYPGQYLEGSTYETGGNGKVTMILRSDILDHPDNWPNSNFVGSYDYNVTYENETGKTLHTEDFTEIEDLSNFPNITEEGNNHEIDLELDWAYPTPDLNVSEGDLKINNETNPEEFEVVENQTVDVWLNITNEGNKDAENVSVEFHLYDGDNNLIDMINETTIDEVNKENYTIHEFEWDVEENHTGADRELIAYVDPEDNKTERREDNNEVSLTFDVLEEAFFEVTIDDYGEEVVEGEDQVVEYIITNTGDENVTQNITFSVFNASNTEGEEIDNFTEENVTLAGGQSHTGTFTWTSTNPGNHSFNVSSEDDEEIRDFVVLEKAFFNVTIDDYGEEVVEGEDQVVNYTITNTGEETTTQNIEFAVYDAYDTGGGVVDTDSEFVTLAGGENYTGTFTWMTTAPGSYSFQISSENHVQDRNFDVLEEAFFEVLIVDYEEELIEGEDQVVNYTVTNLGEETTTQDIEFAVYDAYDTDGGVVYTDTEEKINLGEGESYTGNFTWQSTDPGNYSFEVSSEDHSGSLNFEVLVESYFEVTIDQEQSDVEVVEGEDLTVVAQIENTGEFEGQITQTIELFGDDPDTSVDSQNVTLTAGQDELIDLTWTTEMNDAGDYTVQVASEDEEDDLDVTVLKAAEFTVNIDSEQSDTEGVEGVELDIVADIENIGEEEEIETQTIELLHENGTILDHRDVTLGPGQNERINLTWKTELGDAGNKTQKFYLEVASENNNTDQVIIELNPAPDLNFVSETWYLNGEAMNVSEGFDLEEGDNLTFEGQIKNEGGVPIFNAQIEYLFPDGSGTEQTVNIDAEVNETVNVSAKWNVRVVEDPEISIWVNSTAGDERTHDEIIYIGDDFEDIDPTEINFEDLDFPNEEMVPGEEYHFSGRVVRNDGKPLEDIEVTISIRSNPEIVNETVTTGEDGEFSERITIPDDAAGEYTLEFTGQTYNKQSTQQSVQVESDVVGIAGIPWWIIVVIVAIAAGGAGSTFAYFKFFGVGEMVECGNCGATISADATTCPKCGVDFDMDTVKCSECSEWIPADSDVCPECGVEFVKTGKEVEDYTERMRKQYKKFLRKKKREAQEELGEELSQKEFMDWWKDKPSFVTFEDWLERKEKQRREGSIECPECGTLNSADDAVCQKCGTSLIDIGEEGEEEEIEEDFLGEEETEESEEEEMTFEEELEEEKTEEEEEIPESTEDEETQEGEESEEEEEEEESSESEEETEESEEKEEKKVKKKPKKKVKKKVVKKSDEGEEED
ncbi:MAG: CARDB domain-containing protein [Candidatus Thermoplasmatota archaeon]